MIDHPKHCPKCGNSWWLESQQFAECHECGHKLRTGLGIMQFIAYFVPYAMWVLIGIAILKALGRNYHG